MGEFTGYINKDGVHIKDGRVNRPVPFKVVDENHVVLTWLVLEDGKLYEREHMYEITDSYPRTIPDIEIMKVGIEAHSCLMNYLRERDGG